MTSQKIAVFGAGLMGAAVARQAAKSGHTVSIWARTPGKASALTEEGVRLCATPAEALAHADLIINLTGDCAQLDDTLAGQHAQLNGKDVLNLASGTPANARRIGGWITAAGGAFASGSILAYPEHIGAAEASILVGGDEGLWARRRGAIQNLAGGSSYLGPDMGAAHVFEAGMVGGFFQSAMAALVESATYLKKEGLDPAILLSGFDQKVQMLKHQWEVSLAEMAGGQFTTDQATIASYERSHALFIQAFAEAGAPSDLLSATYAKLKRAKDAGDSESSFSAISKH